MRHAAMIALLVISWDVLPNGLMEIGVDVNGDGEIDRIEYHNILRSFFSAESLEEVKKCFPSKIIFWTDYERDKYFYVVEPEPIRIK